MSIFKIEIYTKLSFYNAEKLTVLIGVYSVQFLYDYNIFTLIGKLTLYNIDFLQAFNYACIEFCCFTFYGGGNLT